MCLELDPIRISGIHPISVQLSVTQNYLEQQCMHVYLCFVPISNTTCAISNIIDGRSKQFVAVSASTNIPKRWRLSQTPQFTAYDYYNDIPGTYSIRVTRYLSSTGMYSTYMYVCMCQYQ